MMNVKSISGIFLFVVLFNIHGINAQPYEVNEDTQRNAGYILGGMGLAYSLTNSDFLPLSVYEIDYLMDRELLGFNQFAVDNYNNDLALVSDILLGVCIAAPVMQLADGRVGPDWTTYGMMYLEAGFLTLGLTTVTKNIARMPRPYIFNPDVTNNIKQTKEGRKSFFSGHAALAFAGMTFFAETYSNYYPETSNHNLIWMGSMTLASATALLRVFSGRHFPIDILVGSAVGFAVGKLIPLMHETPNNIPNQPNFRVQRIFAVSLNI
jgi:membrane-associated phospholipid phosphatase